MLHKRPRQIDTERSDEGAIGPRGIAWPRIYDLILTAITGGREQAYREELLDVSGVVGGMKVLDVGCGTGTQTIAAHRRVQPQGFAVGVDASPKMLAAARRKARRARSEAEFKLADATALPFDDEVFDAVTMTTAVHMVDQAEQVDVLREAVRVLKADGTLSIIDFAGPANTRAGWISKHGRHGEFDLHALQEPLAMLGLKAREVRPLGWLDLYILQGTKVRPSIAASSLNQTATVESERVPWINVPRAAPRQKTW